MTTSLAREPDAPVRPERSRLRRLALGGVDDPRWARPALWAVLALAAVLYGWGLSMSGANEYYSAAVLSGTKSWKAFFYGALDAGSYITVDKPPGALWVMGLSARIFGFHTWSLLLPQVIEGVAAVAVLYRLVRQAFGHAAGLIAALVLTLTPITVAINRDNNPDTLLVLLLLLGAWGLLSAIRSGRLLPLVLCAVAVGFAFNTKMLQAFVVLPAFALAYLLTAHAGWLRRIGHLLVAGVVLAVSSFWWTVIVDLTPAASRPYVGGSTNNTVWDLVMGYNGLGRIFGGEHGGRTGSAPFPSRASDALPRNGGGFGGFGGSSGIGRLFNDTIGGQISWLLPFATIALISGLIILHRQTRRPTPPTASRTADAYDAHSERDAETGSANRSRTEGDAYDARHAETGGVGRSRAGGANSGCGAEVGRLGGVRLAWGSLVLWGGWLAVHFVVFSFAEGIFHPYYTTAMAPAIAALTGAGAVLMWRTWGLPLAVAVTGVWSCVLLSRTADWNPWLGWVIAVSSLVAVLALLLVRFAPRTRVRVIAVVAGLAAILAGPTAYAVTPLSGRTGGMGGSNPQAGPSTGSGFGGMPGRNMPPPGMPGQNGQPPSGTGQNGAPDQNGQPPNSTGQDGMPGQNGQAPGTAQNGQSSNGFPGPGGAARDGGQRMRRGGQVDAQLVKYLEQHRSGATWLVAVSSAMQAAPIILKTGQPVIAMGGFSGTDQAMSVAKLQQYIKSGKLHYIMTGTDRGGPMGGGSTAVTAWVTKNCTLVKPSEYGSSSTTQNLYRCG